MVAIIPTSFLTSSDAVSPTQATNLQDLLLQEFLPRILMPMQDEDLLVIKYVDTVGL